MCNTVSGSTCKALMDIGGGGLPIPMPEGVASGLCSCNTPSDIMALLGCLMGGCPSSPECFAGAVCVDPATIPVLGQMLGAMGPVCVNPSIITDVLGGGLPI